MEILNPVRVEKFWQKVDKKRLDECWNWKGACDTRGYPNFTVGVRKTAKAHRFSFLLQWGWLLPHPYQVDHKCNNTSCVNPYHLRCIHGSLNNEKSNSASAMNKRKTHCKQGHLYTRESTKIERGRRICKLCEKEKGRL